MQLPFTDVREGDWFYDAVAYAHTNELLTAPAPPPSPNGTMTRAVLVTALAAGGRACRSGTSGFPDVADAWYTEAVDWASQTDIVSGTGAGFDPEGSVTREQIAHPVSLCEAQGLGCKQNGQSVGDFADGTDTSAWATRAGVPCGDMRKSYRKDGKCLDRRPGQPR